MTLKKFTLVFALLALLAAGVSAHDDSGSAASRFKHGLGLPFADDILLEATGLDAEALRNNLAEGSTIAELIEANDGDVEEVIANVVAQMTEDIDANLALFLDGLEERVSEELNASHSRRGPWGRRWYRLPRSFAYAGVSEVIMEATGLDATALKSALSEGTTVADLIEANEGDVASVATDIVASITDEVNAAAAERIESLKELVTEAFNTDFAEHWRRRRGRMKPRFFFGFWGMSNMPASEAPAA